MIIQCPSCQLEREVPASAVRPGKIYKVTCPRCSSVFQFSLPEEEETPVGNAAPEVPAPVQDEQPAVTAETPAETPEPTEQPSAKADERPETPRLPSEQDGDDPLPPGAEIPDLSRPEPEQPVNTDEPAENASPNSWDRWHHKESTNVDGERDPYAPRSDGRPAGAPWESPEYYGFWGSFIRTLLGVLFHAADFFRHVRCQFSVIRPILFYVLLSLFQMLAARLWSIKALQELSATTADPQTLAMAEQLMQSMNMPLMLLVTPFFSVFQAVILAGLYHLMIRMVRPDRADFATTLRVVCYSAAPLVLCIIPMVGSIIASIWFVLATFIGCKYALNLPWSRTLLALLPLYILELAFVSQLPALLAV